MVTIRIKGEAVIWESLANANDDGDKVYFSICQEPEVYVNGKLVDEVGYVTDDDFFRRRFIQSYEPPYVFRRFTWYDITTKFELDVDKFDISKLQLPFINKDDAINNDLDLGFVMQYIIYDGRHIYCEEDNTEDTDYYARTGYTQYELDSIS